MPSFLQERAEAVSDVRDGVGPGHPDDIEAFGRGIRDQLRLQKSRSA
jgi:hypothetical protein